SFQSLQTPDQVEDFFRKEFHDTLDLIPDLKSDFFQNPSSSLVTVRCYPWVYKNKSMLIGDAAHAIVPFYGQGMNAGFEDCRIFTELLDGYKGDDWNELLLQYQQLRKRNGDAVAELALQNFIEMRDKVADPVFLERKRIEKQLGLLFPGQFNSVYEMVSFSHTPYADALACQQAQDILLQKIMERGSFDQNLQDEQFRNDLNTWITEYASEAGKILAS
ncbi:MAG TPA: FAD-dependent monooxygenase, partial [Chitinophagaceae bacterium]|nr:FAD-dependent monooxygenase [Chitinophagaceae bacterium]